MTEFMTNQAYWDERKGDYPFWAVQTNHISGPATNPEMLHTARHSSFIRVPFPHATPPYVLWGFLSNAHRDAFLSDFGGEVWLGGVVS